MKISKCKECKSKNILITSDLSGNIIAATCIDCGWAYESDFFKSLTKTFDDPELGFDYKEFSITKKKK